MYRHGGVKRRMTVGSLPTMKLVDVKKKAPGTVPYDVELYKQCKRIERVFGRLKDWRHIATRYDRCAHTFMGAIRIAAALIFWL